MTDIFLTRLWVFPGVFVVFRTDLSVTFLNLRGEGPVCSWGDSLVKRRRGHGFLGVFWYLPAGRWQSEVN